MDNSFIPKSLSLKPVADIDEPIINEQAGIEAVKKNRVKEEVIAELEIQEDEDADLDLKKKQESQGASEHKVVKYGEYKKEIKKPFGKAEQ